MRNLIFAVAAYLLIITSSSLTVWASGNKNNTKASLSGGVAFPSSISFQGATHQFKLDVQTQPVSELVIKLPYGVSINKGIEVKNQSGKKIDAQIAVNNQTATLIFSQPVEPQTTLIVDMRGVNTSLRSHIWLYQVYGKMPNLTTEIPLGTVRIQTYGR
ncbi:hypothetical protein NIES4071_104460 (plasmid) [Calothrix sp. NIES-4071]|nr:hypothetical protein NIES4071_104460 [Calothrix sp. NIES-4071]BAZ64433.1 hypothetical protein NIES4105_101660 [Calothrix sp. NIES-4105]